MSFTVAPSVGARRSAGLFEREKMIAKVQKIKFDGLDLILTHPENIDSPIATIDAFQKGECSYAHISGCGIMRFGSIVGLLSDIEFGEFIEIDVNVGEAIAGVFGNTWPS